MTAEDEAKQLDSVTDRVKEHETLDSSKAKSAMAALTSSSSAGISDHKKLAKIKISKEDVLVIVDELEVSQEDLHPSLFLCAIPFLSLIITHSCFVFRLVKI